MSKMFPELDDLKLAVALPSYNGTRHNGPALFYLREYVPKAIPIATQTSLLAMCFNITFSIAMRLRDEGKATHFLMLHDDIVPLDQNWFEELWSAYKDPEGNNGTGMICAVSPIKDQRGFTSIAVEKEVAEESDDALGTLRRVIEASSGFRGPKDDGFEAWLKANFKDVLDRLSGIPPKRFFTKPQRLTMTQIHNGPQTFTHPGLLLNTGCLLFDMREPWVDQATTKGRGNLYFTIQDHIEWIDGIPHPSSASEDWNFTRMARAAGCPKIYATRKMPLEHIGQARFSSKEVWGLAEDNGT